MSSVESLIAQGENSAVEFKSSSVHAASLAREIVSFTNTNGGTVLVGVEDDGSIGGIEGREDLEEWTANVVRNNINPPVNPVIRRVETSGHEVLVIDVEKGKDKPYQTIDGKFWIRVGSTNRMATKEELSRLFQQAGLVHFDIAPLEGTLETDLNRNKLQEYWEDYYDIDYSRLESVEQEKLLLNADILVENGGERRVSVGGMLIFGVAPQRRLPQSSIQFAVFDGLSLTDDLLDKHEITGTLPELIQQTKTKIETFLPTPSTIDGLQREEQPAIPKKVIREAVVNAVCHRDYSIGNRKISVYLFRDRVEISSPGRLPNTLSIEKILTGNSAPRNHFILKYLDNMKYIDGLGRGVPMIKQQMKDRFHYMEDGEMLRLVLYFNTASSPVSGSQCFG